MFKLMILVGCWIGIFSGQTPKSTLILENKLATAGIGEPFVIDRSELERRYGPANPDDVPVLKYMDGSLIPLQWDDLNGDGKWDQLAFTVNIGPRSNLEIEVDWLPKEIAPKFEKKTQVYLAKQDKDGSFTELLNAEAPVGLDGFPNHYQSEGVGWENDKIAFRVYFDCRNSKDLFGKRVPDLILKKAGSNEWGSYHELAPWGMDILHCGSSLGAGGLALVEGDSLFRLGSTPVYRYTKITEGPVRTIFELRYQGWEVLGHQYEAVERITFWIGKYWFQSEVSIGEFSGEKQVATGIVTTKLDRDPIQFQANPEFTAILTHGKQSLNHDILAMAVLAPSKEVAKIARTSNTDFYKLGYQTVPEKSFSQIISDTYYLSQQIKSNTPSIHYFFAMWGLENPGWNDVNKVKEYICQEADRLSHPLVVHGLPFPAQTSKPDKADSARLKRFHLGFTMGLNTAGFKIIPKGGYDFNLRYNPGININVIADYRLTGFLSLRILPGIQFIQRDLTVTKNITAETKTWKIESILLDLPLLLKYRIQRKISHSPYLIGGIAPRFDYNRADMEGWQNAKPIVKAFDIYPELGVGADFHLSKVKVAIDLKFSQGIRDIFAEPDDPRFNLLTSGISRMYSRMLVLSFLLE